MKKNKNQSQSLLKARALLDSGNQKELKYFLNSLMSIKIVRIISAVSDEEKAIVFSLLNEILAAKTFKFLDLKTQRSLIRAMSHEGRAKLLNEIHTDDRTAFLEECPSETVKELIKLMSDEERKKTLALLGYPLHSVGRLMTPDYLSVQKEWTVQQVLEHVRLHGRDSETINVIYVIDESGVLIDDIRIREFLLVQTDKKVSELMDSQFITLQVKNDEETAINVFRKNNRVALPVTDEKGIMIGIVTIDDVLRLAVKEETEDIQKIGGVEALEEPYMNISFLKLMRKRVGWLIVLFLGEMLTATAMGFFEGEISKAVVLALFVPLIISSGGNSGSQASTLIIRAMALGEVTMKDWWRIMRREIGSGLFLGTALGAIGFARISVWTIFSNIYGPHWLLVASTIFVSLIGVVLWGTLSGSMLPMLLKKLGADPAASSAPFVATLVDVTGLVIYFTVALFFLRGTLL